MSTLQKNHNIFLKESNFKPQKDRLSIKVRKISILMIIGLLILNIIMGNMIIFTGAVGNDSDTSDAQADNISQQLSNPRYLDYDNSPADATPITDATFVNKTIAESLSGLGAAGDDFVDFYKINLNNRAEVFGLNADRLILWINTTALFNVTMSLYDPDMHLLASSETGAPYPNGTIQISAQSSGQHYIKIYIDPIMGYAEYNLTYQLVIETNILLDGNNDFSNGTPMNLKITDMGLWQKKEYDPQIFTLDQTKDIHDFFNLTVNASENITIELSSIPDGNIYGIELFNGSNSSRKLASLRFVGGPGAVNNIPLYYDINYTGNYSLRIFTIYEDPNVFGGSGSYMLYMLVKPQNRPPELRQAPVSWFYIAEDEPTRYLNLNDTVFFDPDIENTNDNLTFSVLNGTTWDKLYVSDNLSVEILNNGSISVQSQQDQSTPEENLTFKACDWLDWNITHNITFVVSPTNDLPYLISVNDFSVTTEHLNLINDYQKNDGAFEDQRFNLTVEAFDVDGDELDFTLIPINSNIKIKSSVGYHDLYKMNYSFTPGHEHVGILQFELWVNESLNFSAPGDLVKINLTVNNTNDPPTIETVNGEQVLPQDTIEFLGKEGVFVGGTLNFTVNAKDIDLQYGDKLTFSTTNVIFVQRGILKLIPINETSTKVSFNPEPVDIGLKEINISVSDIEQATSWIILKIEVKPAETKYSLTDEDCWRNYSDDAGDDYSFYELVYRQPRSLIKYSIMAHTSRGDKPGGDILKLTSNKAEDYMNVSITFRGNILINTTIRIFFVRTSGTYAHLETELDENATELPKPHTPNPNVYFLSFNYDDPAEDDFGNPIKISPKILNFSIHLGDLENTYGIKHGVEFGLYAQAHKYGSNDYDYFTYDSIGEGVMKTPSNTVSHLLTDKECKIEEKDIGDDVYGYLLEYKSQNRSLGLSSKKTKRGGLPEIDIRELTSRKNGFYFEVTLTLAISIVNSTYVSYYVYIVDWNHTEKGIHLEPENITKTSYPSKPYAPLYFQMMKYSNNNTDFEDRIVINNNKIIFKFHLVQLQHPIWGNIGHNRNFGIFAVAVRRMNTTSILEDGFYYDTAGKGAQAAPAVLEEKVEEKEEEVPFIYILGHIGGIPILILIIIGIIVICIIAGYAYYIKASYGGMVDVDVKPVPPVPSARGASAPNYGVWPGFNRDEKYYETLYQEEPEPGYDEYGEYPEYGYGAPTDQYGYDVIPEEEMPEMMGEEIPEMTPTGAPLLEPGGEEEMVEEVEPDLHDIHLPDEDLMPEAEAEEPELEPETAETEEEWIAEEEAELEFEIETEEETDESEIEGEDKEELVEFSEEEAEPVVEEEPVSEEEEVVEGEESEEETEEEEAEEEVEEAESEEEFEVEFDEGEDAKVETEEEQEEEFIPDEDQDQVAESKDTSDK